MSPRSKREPTVIADDPESRGAGEVETLPVPDSRDDADGCCLTCMDIMGDEWPGGSGVSDEPLRPDRVIDHWAQLSDIHRPHKDSYQKICDRNGWPECPFCGRTLSTDSTGPLLEDNATVESMLAYKEVSVTELFEDGSRGIRMYLGKPSLDTFDVMRRRSKGIGVVIEAEGASVEHVRGA